MVATDIRIIGGRAAVVVHTGRRPRAVLQCAETPQHSNTVASDCSAPLTGEDGMGVGRRRRGGGTVLAEGAEAAIWSWAGRRAWVVQRLGQTSERVKLGASGDGRFRPGLARQARQTLSADSPRQAPPPAYWRAFLSHYHFTTPPAAKSAIDRTTHPQRPRPLVHRPQPCPHRLSPPTSPSAHGSRRCWRRSPRPTATLPATSSSD